MRMYLYTYRSVAIVVGPEGGWADGEIDSLIQRVPQVTRVRTASAHRTVGESVPEGERC